MFFVCLEANPTQFTTLTLFIQANQRTFLIILWLNYAKSGFQNERCEKLEKIPNRSCGTGFNYFCPIYIYVHRVFIWNQNHTNIDIPSLVTVQTNMILNHSSFAFLKSVICRWTVYFYSISLLKLFFF